MGGTELLWNTRGFVPHGQASSARECGPPRERACTRERRCLGSFCTAEAFRVTETGPNTSCGPYHCFVFGFFKCNCGLYHVPQMGSPCAAVGPPVTVAPSPHGAVLSWSSFSGQHCCTLVSRCSSFGGSLGGFVVVRVPCSGQFGSKHPLVCVSSTVDAHLGPFPVCSFVI